MKIREVDDFVNWFKNNVFDLPQGSEDMDFRGPKIAATTAYGRPVDQVILNPSREEMDIPTEYNFPLSLLEDILGLDRQ